MKDMSKWGCQSKYWLRMQIFLCVYWSIHHSNCLMPVKCLWSVSIILLWISAKTVLIIHKWFHGTCVTQINSNWPFCLDKERKLFCKKWAGGWGCEVSCGGHHGPRGKTTTGSALDGAVFWHHSNTQYEQIPIILGVWSFWLTPFFFRSITFWRAYG